MVRLAAQHVDRAARLVAVLGLAGEQRPGARLGYAPAGLVLVEGALQRPQQQIALGAVGIDHPEPGVGFTVRRLYGFPDLGDIGCLAAKDEKLTGLEFRL